MKAWSLVVTAPAVNFWPPALIVMSKSTSGSLSSPWLWKGPVSFSEIGPSSWDAAAPVASSLAPRSRLTLPLSTFFSPLKVWLMSCWALSSVPEASSPPHAVTHERGHDQGEREQQRQTASAKS